MKDTILHYFTGIETEKRNTLFMLMNKWYNSISNKENIDWFYTDGFFPNYFSQKHKVLFIGREARWITSGGDNVVHGDYIGSSIRWLETGIQKGNFWRRILNMVQLFKSDGKKEFEQLLSFKDCAKEMVENHDYGFAIMNISKYSNDTDGGGEADYDFINQFLEDSQLEKHNFFQEELKILNPDFIITFDLWENGKIDHKYLDLCFGKKTALDEYPKTSPDGRLYEIDLDGKKVKLIDIYHPASRKPDKDCFYTPIKELLFSN